MDLVHKAEKAMEPAFKSLPPLPKDLKKGIADITPWLALIGGVLQLLAAWWLYRWASAANELVEWANRLSAAYGGPTTSRMTFWVWLGVASLVISGVIMLLAFPRLQKRQKAGWGLLFLGALFNVVYAVISLFIDGRGGVGSLLWTLLMSAVGFYVLFQIREHYGGKALNSGHTTEK